MLSNTMQGSKGQMCGYEFPKRERESNSCNTKAKLTFGKKNINNTKTILSPFHSGFFNVPSYGKIDSVLFFHRNNSCCSTHFLVNSFAVLFSVKI